MLSTIGDVMLDHVTFENIAPDGLTGERWSFYLLYNKLVVNSYSIIERETKRHKWKTLKQWSRHHDRNSMLRQNDVPLTDAIKVQAKAEFLRQFEETVTVGFQKS